MVKRASGSNLRSPSFFPRTANETEKDENFRRWILRRTARRIDILSNDCA